MTDDVTCSDDALPGLGPNATLRVRAPQAVKSLKKYYSIQLLGVNTESCLSIHLRGVN